MEDIFVLKHFLKEEKHEGEWDDKIGSKGSGGIRLIKNIPKNKNIIHSTNFLTKFFSLLFDLFALVFLTTPSVCNLCNTYVIYER